MGSGGGEGDKRGWWVRKGTSSKKQALFEINIQKKMLLFIIIFIFYFPLFPLFFSFLFPPLLFCLFCFNSFSLITNSISIYTMETYKRKEHPLASLMQLHRPMDCHIIGGLLLLLLAVVVVLVFNFFFSQGLHLLLLPLQNILFLNHQVCFLFLIVKSYLTI